MNASLSSGANHPGNFFRPDNPPTFLKPKLLWNNSRHQKFHLSPMGGGRSLLWGGCFEESPNSWPDPNRNARIASRYPTRGKFYPLPNTLYKRQNLRSAKDGS